MNIYEGIKSELETRGRMIRQMTGPSGKTCLLGAIHLANGVTYESITARPTDYFINTPETHTLASIIKEQYPEWYSENAYKNDFVLCYVFNDDHETQDVYTILEKAAANG